MDKLQINRPSGHYVNPAQEYIVRVFLSNHRGLDVGKAEVHRHSCWRLFYHSDFFRKDLTRRSGCVNVSSIISFVGRQRKIKSEDKHVSITNSISMKRSKLPA